MQRSLATVGFVALAGFVWLLQMSMLRSRNAATVVSHHRLGTGLDASVDEAGGGDVKVANTHHAAYWPAGGSRSRPKRMNAQSIDAEASQADGARAAAAPDHHAHDKDTEKDDANMSRLKQRNAYGGATRGLDERRAATVDATITTAGGQCLGAVFNGARRVRMYSCMPRAVPGMSMHVDRKGFCRHFSMAARLLLQSSAPV